MNDTRYTVPWIPGMHSQAELAGWMVRELFDAAAVMRDEQMTAAEVAQVALITISESNDPKHQRFATLAMSVIEMGLHTEPTT